MSIEPVRNFYEDLVSREILVHVAPGEVDPDYLADIACVALNHLPPRYIRHTIDLIFYLSPAERAEIDRKVTVAVADAVKYIAAHRRAA